MAPGPKSPAEYGEGQDDAALEAAGYAAGLDVWGQVEKAYSNYLGDGTLANSQLWSLRQAIRAEMVDELKAETRRHMDSWAAGREHHRGECEEEVIAVAVPQWNNGVSTLVLFAIPLAVTQEIGMDLTFDQARRVALGPPLVLTKHDFPEGGGI